MQQSSEADYRNPGAAELQGQATAQGMTPVHSPTPGSLLDRRLKFERSHPEIRITPPTASKTGLWEASWTENGTNAKITSSDGDAFFNDLEKRFAS